jgi:hypothetical protein
MGAQTWATKFRAEAPKVCGSSVWRMLHVIVLAYRVLWWFLELWRICTPMQIKKKTNYKQLKVSAATIDLSIKLYFIGATLHVSDQSIPHQVYTDLKFELMMDLMLPNM